MFTEAMDWSRIEVEELPAEVLVCTLKAFPRRGKRGYKNRGDTRIGEEDEAVGIVLVFTQCTLLIEDRKSRF